MHENFAKLSALKPLNSPFHARILKRYIYIYIYQPLDIENPRFQGIALKLKSYFSAFLKQIFIQKSQILVLSKQNSHQNPKFIAFSKQISALNSKFSTFLQQIFAQNSQIYTLLTHFILNFLPNFAFKTLKNPTQRTDYGKKE